MYIDKLRMLRQSLLCVLDIFLRIHCSQHGGVYPAMERGVMLFVLIKDSTNRPASELFELNGTIKDLHDYIGL